MGGAKGHQSGSVRARGTDFAAPGVRDLHLRLDRHAQRRDGRASEAWSISCSMDRDASGSHLRDRLLLSRAFQFDVAALGDLYLPLMRGSALIVASESKHGVILDALLATYRASSGVDQSCKLHPPTAVRELLNAGTGRNRSELRWCLSAAKRCQLHSERLGISHQTARHVW